MVLKLCKGFEVAFLSIVDKSDRSQSAFNDQSLELIDQGPLMIIVDSRNRAKLELPFIKRKGNRS